MPQYLVMGMTPTQYWDEDPRLAIAYRKAYRLRKASENEFAWLQGVYIMDGFAVALANAFKKKGQRAEMYFEKPIDIFPLTPEEKQRREQEEIEKTQQALRAMARRQRQQKKQKGE